MSVIQKEIELDFHSCLHPNDLVNEVILYE